MEKLFRERGLPSIGMGNNGKSPPAANFVKVF
jgi:hypothetical protein